MNFDTGTILWIAFLAVFAVGIFISKKISRQIDREGIETTGYISRITDIGDPDEVDIHVYVKYRTEDGEEIEGTVLNPRADLMEGQTVRLLYHPKHKHNAKLI